CRTHGPAEIVDDGKTGWLIPPDDQDSLTDALVAAASDHQKRLAYGRRAQAESRHHGWPATIHRLTPLYHQLAAPAPGRPPRPPPTPPRPAHGTSATQLTPRASPLNPHTETSLSPPRGAPFSASRRMTCATLGHSSGGLGRVDDLRAAHCLRQRRRGPLRARLV